MVNVLLTGSGGKMGQIVAQVASESSLYRICAGVDTNPQAVADTDFPVFSSFEEVSGEFDVIVDFSHHSAVEGILKFAQAERIPAVICTTGHTEAELEMLRAASRCVPVFYSRNMSIGINLLAELVKKAAASLYGFDIEIVEKHHNRKLDAPSGTALMLAEAASQAREGETQFVYERQSRREARKPQELGIHSVRGGTIVGEHEVIFAGPDEVITLSHSAASREVFAQGALRAAAFIVGKPAALYDMNDLIHESDFR